MFESFRDHGSPVSPDKLDEETKIEERVTPDEAMERIFSAEDGYIEELFENAKKGIDEHNIGVCEVVKCELPDHLPEGIGLDSIDVRVRVGMEASSHGLMPLEIGERAVFFLRLA